MSYQLYIENEKRMEKLRITHHGRLHELAQIVCPHSKYQDYKRIKEGCLNLKEENEKLKKENKKLKEENDEVWEQASKVTSEKLKLHSEIEKQKEQLTKEYVVLSQALVKEIKELKEENQKLTNKAKSFDILTNGIFHENLLDLCDREMLKELYDLGEWNFDPDGWITPFHEESDDEESDDENATYIDGKKVGEIVGEIHGHN